MQMWVGGGRSAFYKQLTYNCLLTLFLDCFQIMPNAFTVDTVGMYAPNEGAPVAE